MTLAIASNPNPTIVTDDVYDRDRASDGFSRFGAYLARAPPGDRRRRSRRALRPGAVGLVRLGHGRAAGHVTRLRRVERPD